MANNLQAPALSGLPSLSHQDQIILLLRLPRAQAAGIDALVQRGVDEGELAPDQLEHLSVLTANLAADLEQLAAFLDEIGVTNGGRHE